MFVTQLAAVFIFEFDDTETEKLFRLLWEESIPELLRHSLFPDGFICVDDYTPDRFLFPQPDLTQMFKHPFRHIVAFALMFILNRNFPPVVVNLRFQQQQ